MSTVWSRSLLLGVSLGVAAVAGCAPGSASSTPSASAPGPATSGSPSASASSGLPDFRHVWIIVLENQDFDRVVGADDMPYFNALIDGAGLAEQSFGVARPSQPNYFALFSGSTHGVTDNGNHDLAAPSIADQIEASGRTWKEHAENRPADCFTGSRAVGGRDGPGEYRRKHAPAISFDAIRNDPARCANLLDLTAFRPGDTHFALIVPNQCHAAHDCPVADADRWLAEFVPTILDSAAFEAGGLLIVTFDEDDGGDPHGGHIATVLASTHVPAGFRSGRRYDHHSVLRTIQDAWGLGCLAESCHATPMGDFFLKR